MAALETEGVDLGVVVAALAVVVVGLVETVIEAGALEVTEAVLEATGAALAATEVVSEVTEEALAVTEEVEGSGEDSEAEVTVSEVGLVVVDSAGETILVAEGASGNLDHPLNCSLFLNSLFFSGVGGAVASVIKEAMVSLMVSQTAMEDLHRTAPQVDFQVRLEEVCLVDSVEVEDSEEILNAKAQAASMKETPSGHDTRLSEGIFYLARFSFLFQAKVGLTEVTWLSYYGLGASIFCF